ncbi:sex peptide receptor-like [Octopus vulgaris]|uniref:Sex peptide receptor-like n=2 Tax=Octopus TaxID=6643 RepID=A0AA36AYR5_OCTVU|nr:sex peptide receptor-like [Octopus sinensis]XP_036359693.1 sex peptide receptor-like [Octopus sinensis]XP_036359694.1 sex peptide receptor-like [Octopus sinensis]XP_036359695.1 sex peptide receptor-like [Octopus sinensis]CAI9724755.1 sex peptide receptor-like [Octopus vulgaris]
MSAITHSPMYPSDMFSEDNSTQILFYDNATNITEDELPLDTNNLLMAYHYWYAGIHGYVASIVCIFGVITNILNIIVLTRKNMISPSNIILTGLAISDGLTMALYFPFALNNYVIYGPDSPESRDSIGDARFLFAYAVCSVVVHSISIWLTVTLALFRYIFIRYPRKGTYLCSIPRAKLAVILVTVVTTIVCVPNSATLEIKCNAGHNSTMWYVDFRENNEAERILKKMNFWVHAFILKLLPSLLLTILSILLVKTMQEVEIRRKRLLSRSGRTDDDSGRERKTNRTTKMLLTVVVLFLITETPHGIFILIGTFNSFFKNYYIYLGDTLDILTLINNGINFVLYCTMSKQFRETFIRIFFRSFIATDVGQLQLVSTQATRYSEV